MKKPYWYCSFCKSAKLQVPAPAPGNCDAVERCPDCRNNSLVWLEFTPRKINLPSENRYETLSITI
jgi:hypothetical protein